MKRFMTLLALLLSGMQGAYAFNVDAFMDKHIAPISDAVANLIFFPISICGSKVPIIIFWILIAGIFFTIYFKGVAIWGFKHAIDSVAKPAEKHHDGCGEVSSFQALATALSGTIGIGSIAGVAISISIGGPGAAFWIFLGALLGMSIKFVEATLAVKYRRFNMDGSVSGGPMHYIAHGLTRKNMRWLGQPLSVVFAILCIGGGITGGNMIQINQTAHQLVFITGGEHSFLHGWTWVVGLVVAILIGLVVVGGIKSIAKVTTVLVPTMCIMYIISGLIVIFANISNIPSALLLILKEAFHPTAVAGGAIIFSGVLKTTHIGKISGIELASNAFQSVIPFFPYILSAIAVMFALSTLISWAYYSQKAWTFLVGEGKKRALSFNIVYCIFIVIGSVMNVESKLLLPFLELIRLELLQV